jgi:hypothetical protein
MHETAKEKRKDRALHKDWRTWAVVLLMVGAMAIYVLTLDDSVVPGSMGRTQAPAQGKPPPSAP